MNTTTFFTIAYPKDMNNKNPDESGWDYIDTKTDDLLLFVVPYKFKNKHGVQLYFLKDNETYWHFTTSIVRTNHPIDFKIVKGSI